MIGLHLAFIIVNKAYTIYVFLFRYDFIGRRDLQRKAAIASEREYLHLSTHIRGEFSVAL